MVHQKSHKLSFSPSNALQWFHTKKASGVKQLLGRILFQVFLFVYMQEDKTWQSSEL